MKFVKGQPRPAGAGRKKGTPNKSTSLLHRFDSAGFDVEKEMRDFYLLMIQERKYAIAGEFLLGITKYCFPELKPEERPSTQVFVNSNPYMEVPREELMEALRTPEQCGSAASN